MKTESSLGEYLAAQILFMSSRWSMDDILPLRKYSILDTSLKFVISCTIRLERTWYDNHRMKTACIQDFIQHKIFSTYLAHLRKHQPFCLPFDYFCFFIPITKHSLLSRNHLSKYLHSSQKVLQDEHQLEFTSNSKRDLIWERFDNVLVYDYTLST